MEGQNKYHVAAANLKRLELYVTRILRVLYEWEIHKGETKIVALKYALLM